SPQQSEAVPYRRIVKVVSISCIYQKYKYLSTLVTICGIVSRNRPIVVITGRLTVYEGFAVETLNIKGAGNAVRCRGLHSEDGAAHLDVLALCKRMRILHGRSDRFPDGE